MRHHDDGEEDGEDDADDGGALRAGFEGEQAINERCGEQMHRQLIHWPESVAIQQNAAQGGWRRILIWVWYFSVMW